MTQMQEMQGEISSDELLALAHTSPSGLAWVANLQKPDPTKPKQNPSRWIHAKHVDYLDELLIKLHARELQADGYVGLIVEEPPRHGKSELATHYDSVYYLGAHPDHRIILASYAADFASDWGAKCRDTFEAWAPELYGLDTRRDRRAADRWDIKGHRGGMITAGAGGAITGRGADYLKADDLIKNYAEAQSQTIRDNVWGWWQSTFRTRLEPGGVILVIGTRWHEDDIIGRLLAAQGDSHLGKLHPLYDPAADKFLRVRLPALAELPDEDFPEPDPLGREEGEPLFKERFDVPALLQLQATVGPVQWAALFQQRPAPAEGGLFKEENFDIVPHPGGKFKRVVRRWDLAGSDPQPGIDPDWSVGLLLGLHEDGLYYVLDVVRFRDENVEPHLKRVRNSDGRRIRVRIEQEPGSQGKLYIRSLGRRMFAGYNFRGIPSSGSKMLRADTVAAASERREIKVVRAAWNREFIREITKFPYGSHDDQVDALSGAHQDLTLRSGGVKTW